MIKGIAIFFTPGILAVLVLLGAAIFAKTSAGLNGFGFLGIVLLAAQDVWLRTLVGLGRSMSGDSGGGQIIHSTEIASVLCMVAYYTCAVLRMLKNLRVNKPIRRSRPLP